MGNSKSVRQHLESAQKTGTLQLGKLGLKEIPADLQRVSGNLRVLDLSNNQLVILPASIGRYEQLKTLNLSSNRLGQLPEDIGNLKKIEVLNFDHNHLSGLPESMSKLQSLRRATFSSNKIVRFPVQLCSIKRLEFLDLSQNKISSIPDSVNSLQAVELVLNQNQISRLPESIAECSRLKVLRLQENCLELSTFTPKIMKEAQISLLDVDGNLFDMKAFHNVAGYDEYMERYTANKKKMY